MVQGQLERDTITYSASISACEKGVALAKALELLGTMMQGEVEQNTITYIAAIGACEKCDDWVEGLGYCGAMARCCSHLLRERQRNPEVAKVAPCHGAGPE